MDIQNGSKEKDSDALPQAYYLYYMSQRVILIAEAGVNHNGSMDMAFELIDAAVAAGVDMVKFQTFCTEELVDLNAPKAAYQAATTSADESQFDMLKRLELDEAKHIALIDYCTKKGIEFLSTPFDIPSIDLLFRLKVAQVKIPSGEINNVPYLRHLSGKFSHYYLSTGMSDMEEIAFAVKTLNVPMDQLTILHCNTEYPTALADVNLLAMRSIAETFHCGVGYSDHTLGWEVAVAAVAMGARVVEKHFTLDKHLPGPDHKASLEPHEMKELVEKVRGIEIALGSADKLVSEAALRNAKVAKKSIVAACAIKKGELFTAENLKVKRPGTGMSPTNWDLLIGKPAKESYFEGQLINDNEK